MYLLKVIQNSAMHHIKFYLFFFLIFIAAYRIEASSCRFCAQRKIFSEPEHYLTSYPLSLVEYSAQYAVKSITFRHQLPQVPLGLYHYFFEGFERALKEYKTIRKRSSKYKVLHKNFVFFMKNFIDKISAQEKVSNEIKEKERVDLVFKFKDMSIYKNLENPFFKKLFNREKFELDFLKSIGECTLQKYYNEEFLQKILLIRRMSPDGFGSSTIKQRQSIKKIILELPHYPLFQSGLPKVKGRNIWCLLDHLFQDPETTRVWTGSWAFNKVILESLYEKDPIATAHFINEFYSEIVVENIIAAWQCTQNPFQGNSPCVQIFDLFNTIIECNPNFNTSFITALLQFLNRPSINIITLYLLNTIIKQMEYTYSRQQIQNIAKKKCSKENYFEKKLLFTDPYFTDRSLSFDEDMLEKLHQEYLQKEKVLAINTKDTIIKILKNKCGYPVNNNEA